MHTEALRKYVDAINKAINEMLMADFGYTQTENYKQYLHNLCKPIHYASGEILPCEYVLPIIPQEKTDRNLPNFENVVFTDKHLFQAYHRILPSQITQDTQTETVTINAQVLLTIYTKFDSISILEKIAKILPQVIFDAEQNNHAKIELANVSLDEKSIFAQERGNVAYNLNIHWHLLQITYKLGLTLKKYC